MRPASLRGAAPSPGAEDSRSHDDGAVYGKRVLNTDNPPIVIHYERALGVTMGNPCGFSDLFPSPSASPVWKKERSH